MIFELQRPFLLDASGIISVLSGPGPSLPPSKLNQLARLKLLRMPDGAYLEARVKDSKAKRWVEANIDLVVLPETPSIIRHLSAVRAKCTALKGFLGSLADVMVVCTALELNEQERRTGTGFRHVVVARDGQLEAACFLMGIDRISPAAFVQVFASTPLP